MSWRGRQPSADIDRAVAQAEYVAKALRRPEAQTYVCRVCEWVTAQDGCAYDSLMDVCFHCVRRLVNLHSRKHCGHWFRREDATDEDLAYFFDTREPPQPAAQPARYAKAKIKTALRLKIYERDGFKCVYCGARKDLTIDHVTAEANGGATTEGNLVTACRPCNSGKKTKSLADFWEARQ